MPSLLEPFDHRNNEFYSFRYSSRFQKGEVVEMRLGPDLEAARFQARKNFPDVLNEYWWLKPSDIPMMRGMPFQISDIFFYTGGIPVLVLVTAHGNMFRKAQIFMKGKDDSPHGAEADLQEKMESLPPDELETMLLSPNLFARRAASQAIKDKHPGYQIINDASLLAHLILSEKYDQVAKLGPLAVDSLLERFYVTIRSKEHEMILQTIVQIGNDALPYLEDSVEYISEMASPFYAKRLKWTISEIKKRSKSRIGQ